MSSDVIHRFSFADAPIRGQWVRLCDTVREARSRQTCPPAGQQLLGEMLAAVALMADAIKFHGTVSLQARGTGAVGTALAENLEGYFINSEQLPTRLFFATQGGTDRDRVTGLLLQRLPDSGETVLSAEAAEAAWHEIDLLAGTIRPSELGEFPLEVLLRRLFREHTITIHPARSLAFSCTCSRERAGRTLQALPKDEILELLESRGSIDVTCEVCGARYDFDRFDTHLVYEAEAPRLH
jgi:redox-regulated HSP33 family molecular chaperone